MKKVFFILFFCGSFILKFQSFGQDWQIQQSTTTKMLNAITFTDQNNGWAVGRDNLILHTSDGGMHWEKQPVPDDTIIDVDRHYFDSTLYDVCFISKDSGWAVGSKSLLQTIDGGKSWKHYKTAINSFLGGIFFINHRKGWVAGSEGKILFTQDGGTTWMEQINSLGSLTTEWFSDIYFSDELNGWAVGGFGNPSLFYTKDGGRNWYKGDVSGTNGEIISVYFANNKLGWVGTDDGKILCSKDGGNTWVTQYNGSGWILDISFTDNQTGWAIGQGGTILYTNNGGITWEIQTSPVNVDLRGMFIGFGKMWIVGMDGTIISKNQPTGILNTSGEINSVNIYPNPVKDLLTLDFDNKELKEVKLINSLGQLVYYSSELTRNKIQIDTKNFPSGMYYISIQAKEGVLQKKVIVNHF